MDPDSHLQIAITIPIKNHSGKIVDRFPFQNRSAFFIFKSISVFHFQIDQRLKNGFRNKNSDGTQNRIAIFVRKSITGFQIKIDQRFYFFNCDPIFRSKSRSQSRSKTIPEKSISDFHFIIGSRFQHPPSTFARNSFPSGLVNKGNSDSATTELRSAITVSFVIGLNPSFSVSFL
jgi:hypothetical protein